jgi:hypothetical protein
MGKLSKSEAGRGNYFEKNDTLIIEKKINLIQFWKW